MSSLNFNDNLYLGTQEFRNFQNFNSKFITFLGICANNFGFIEPNDALRIQQIDSVSKENRQCFQVRRGSNGILNIATPSYALAWDQNAKSFNMITWDQDRQIKLPESYYGNSYYMKISYDISHIEKGTLQINSEGQVVGTSTEFTSLLRQEPTFPSRIRLFTYDGLAFVQKYDCIVDSINSDTSIKIYEEGTGTIPDTSLTYYYAVLGTYPLDSYIPDNEYLYNYDSCKIDFIQVNDDNTIPDQFQMQNSSDSFYIAKIDVSSTGEITVTDKRFIYENVENDTEGVYSKWFKMK